MKLPSPVAVVVATLVLDLALIQPNHPDALTPGALKLFPLELPVLLLAALLVPTQARWQMAFRLLVVIWLGLTIVLKLADYGTFTALGGRFNPLLDLHLVAAGWNLGLTNLGTMGFLAALLAVVLACLLVFGLIGWAIGIWSRLSPSRSSRGFLRVAFCCALLVWAADLGQSLRLWRTPVDIPGAAFTSRIGIEHLLRFIDTRSELERFRAAARSDPVNGRHALFSDLENTDVLIVFVESYGRSSLEHPLYAPTHTATLERAGTKLGQAGYAIRSGWLVAPTAGGQSWLSHATVANGLWISDQIRYGALLASDRQSLFHLARSAGFSTAAVMPAITRAWPEASTMGFERVFAAKDMDYRGKPFNWITMPDQYTLAFLHERLRKPSDADGPPLFAQIALISSHAPWTPVPELLPWDAIGDGRPFDRWAESGDSPAEVWRDRDRIRDQFRRAIDYSLDAVFAYAAYSADNKPLMIVLGDHPPAPFVSQISGADTPMHVIGPQELVERFDTLNWSDSLFPDGDTPPLRMDELRALLIDAYSDPER